MVTMTELARQGEAAGFGSMYTVEAGRSALVSAAAVIAALPTILVYVVAGRYFLRGLMSGAVKG